MKLWFSLGFETRAGHTQELQSFTKISSEERRQFSLCPTTLYLLGFKHLPKSFGKIFGSSCLLFSSTPLSYCHSELSAVYDLPDPTCLNDENEKAFTKYVYYRYITIMYIALNVFISS